MNAKRRERKAKTVRRIYLRLPTTPCSKVREKFTTTIIIIDSVFPNVKRVNTLEANEKLLIPRNLPPIKSRDALVGEYKKARDQIRYFLTLLLWLNIFATKRTSFSTFYLMLVPRNKLHGSEGKKIDVRHKAFPLDIFYKQEAVEEDDAGTNADASGIVAALKVR